MGGLALADQLPEYPVESCDLLLGEVRAPARLGEFRFVVLLGFVGPVEALGQHALVRKAQRGACRCHLGAGDDLARDGSYVSADGLANRIQ